MNQPTQRDHRRVLRIADIHPEVDAALDSEHDALVLPADPAERTGFLAEHGEGITVAVCSGRKGVTASILELLPSLEAIINFGVGYDTTDVETARARGIAVSNTPRVLDDCVADTALGLYLNTLRRFPDAGRFVEAGGWDNDGYPLTHRASGRRVGILGLGHIGKAIARRLEGFGAELHYSGRNRQQGVEYAYHPDVRSLARAVEVLIVAVPGGPATEGLVDAEVLAALGSNGYLINIARGSVVDEEALVDAVTTGGLAGVGLDVVEHEPRVPQALLGRPEVVVTPHVGSGTVETRHDMASLVLRNLESWLTSRSLVTPI